MYSEKTITLFDEYGTPTFREDRENKFFLGIGASYRYSDEEILFNQMNELMGLQRTKPVKNNKISPQKAIDIAKGLKQLPIFLVIVAIDLSSDFFNKAFLEYKSISNEIRKKERGIKERPIGHIIHTRVLDNCLFESITLSLEHNPLLCNFDVFIDNWSIPSPDTSIYLKLRPESLSRNISKLFPDVSISPIQLLDRDSKRKRFIDTISSVVSRKFYFESSDKYTDIPFNILFSNSSNNSVYLDITQKETEFIEKMLKEYLRDC